VTNWLLILAFHQCVYTGSFLLRCRVSVRAEITDVLYRAPHCYTGVSNFPHDLAYVGTQPGTHPRRKRAKEALLTPDKIKWREVRDEERDGERRALSCVCVCVCVCGLHIFPGAGARLMWYERTLVQFHYFGGTRRRVVKRDLRVGATLQSEGSRNALKHRSYYLYLAGGRSLKALWWLNML